MKTPQVLSAVDASAYIPIDISGEFLRESVSALAKDFPHLPMHPIEGDFTHPLALPYIRDAALLGFFPGSTIGNLVPEAAINLLRAMRATLGGEAMLLIGIDRIKSLDILLPAYDDAQKVTAQFNLNLLHRINAELNGDIEVKSFRHVARWNDAHARIEMHLEATRNLSFQVAGHGFSMARGETIHTENSYKYGPRDANLLLRAGGWNPLEVWTDANELFALVLARACTPPPAP